MQLPLHLKAAAVSKAQAPLARALRWKCLEQLVFHFENEVCGLQLRLFRDLIGDFEHLMGLAN